MKSKHDRLIPVILFVIAAVFILGYTVFHLSVSPLASIPTRTELAQVSGSSPTVIFLTSGSTWTVPSDWNSSNNTIETIGGGGGGGPGGSGCGNNPGGGGGGGAYSKAVNVSLTPGTTVAINIGSGGNGGSGSTCAPGTAGGNTYIENSANTVVVQADGGGYGISNSGGAGAGGSTSGGVGNTQYAGGAGGNGSNNYSGGGGGGAAGPNGAGQAGTASGASNIGYPGGNGDNGLGGSGTAGGAGTEWGGYGAGGGGASSVYGSGSGNGGSYGAGGAGGDAGYSGLAGNGAQGIIVITYSAGSGSLVTHSLTVVNSNPSEGGITSSPSGVSCGSTCSIPSIGSGSTYTLTAAPNSGYTASWSGCTSSSGNACSVTLSSNISVTATFIQQSSGTCAANTYYVDFSSGSDTNSGTCSGNPWKHAPGDSNATGVPASTQLNPGNTVSFKGGVVYYGSITAAQSGSSGSPITYQGNSSWGSGKAIMDGSQSPGSYIGFIIQNLSYIHIDNFEIRKFDQASTGSGVGVYIVNSNSIEVSNNLIDQMGDWNTNYVNPNGGGIILGSISSNLSIHGNEITEIGHTGIQVDGQLSNINVYDNNIHDWIVWGIDVAPGNPGLLSGIYIYGNTIHDLWQYNPYGPHIDYIFVRDTFYNGDPNPPQPATDVHITGNLFYNTAPLSASNQGGTAFVYLSGDEPGLVNHITLWNNVFINPYSYASIEMGDVDSVSILNNTIGGGLWVANGTNITIEDNSIAGVVLHDTQNFSTFHMDYNLFVGNPASEYSADVIVAFVSNANDEETYTDTLPQWLADTVHSGYTFDTHSLFTPSWSGVAQLDTTNLGSLSAGSPAIGAGANLSSYFTTDFNGNSRPSSGPWSIGAYQYGSSGGSAPAPLPSSVPAPVSPVISSVSAGNTTSSTTVISWTTSTLASSQVKYGLITAYGSQTGLISTLATSHSVSLSGLSPNTVYDYAVISTDASNNTVTSTNGTFTTLSSGSPVPPASSGGGSTSASVSSASVSAASPVGSAGVPASSLPASAPLPAAASCPSGLVCTPSASASGVSAALFSRTLSVGSTGSDVLALQTFLDTHGYVIAAAGAGSLGNETTYFGSLTAKALSRFETANGLSPTGTLNTATRTLLNSLDVPAQAAVASRASAVFTTSLKLGETSPEVKSLQVFLNNEGYTVATSGNGSKGHETSYFGPATYRALIRFQDAYATEILKPYGLSQGTGYFGTATMGEVNALEK